MVELLVTVMNVSEQLLVFQRMIKSIKLKFGKAPKLNPELINLTPVTIFVGPNNSGKSKILTEINHRCTHGTIHHDGVILDEIEFEGLSEDDANLKIEELTLEPHQNENVPPNNIVVRKKASRIHVSRENLFQALQSLDQHIGHFIEWFLLNSTLILDGLRRLNLVSQMPMGDLQSAPTNSLRVLF